MNDYGCDFPLWQSPAGAVSLGSAESFAIGPVQPDELPLTAELVDDLTAWAKEFSDNFRQESGWPWSEKQVAAYRRRGERLAGRLRAELGDGYVVATDFWEC